MFSNAKWFILVLLFVMAPSSVFAADWYYMFRWEKNINAAEYELFVRKAGEVPNLNVPNYKWVASCIEGSGYSECKEIQDNNRQMIKTKMLGPYTGSTEHYFTIRVLDSLGNIIYTSNEIQLTTSGDWYYVVQWDANSEDDLAGYRLFKSLATSSYRYAEPSYEWDDECKVACVKEIDPETEVMTVTTGKLGPNGDQKIFVVVRAFDTDGLESADSDELAIDPRVYMELSMKDNQVIILQPPVLRLKGI